MRTRRTSLVLCALALGGALAAGCGSDDEERQGIPSDLASRLETRLDVVERQLREGGGACADIQNETFRVIEQDLGQIPADTDPEVRSALEESFQRLQELARSECDEERGQETTPTETEQTPTLPEVPTETETTPTETEEQEGQGEQNGNKDDAKGREKNRGGGQGEGPPAGNDGGAGVPQGE